MRDPFADLRAYAADLETQVPAERARVRAMAALHPSKPRRRTSVIAAAVVGFMGISNVALAAVANPAVPGDALYGVDRAYERVGSALGFAGGARFELLSEAATVVARGQSATALMLVEEALSGIASGDEETARAMLAELERGADVQALQDQLQQMLDIAQDTAETASDEDLRGAARSAQSRGLSVAEAAKEIRSTIELPDAASQETPGENGNGGPPDDPGPPTESGNDGESNGNGPPDTEESGGGSPASTRPTNGGNGGNGGNSGKSDKS
jgi:hypothetical protein